MQVNYRGLEPAEIEPVIELWAQTLDAPREQIVHDFRSDPEHVAHTRVAAAPDGRLLAAVHYCHFNAARPLTTLRDQRHWREVIGPRLRLPPVQIFTAAPAVGGPPCGYVVTHLHPTSLVVTELGVLPGQEPALPALLVAASIAAQARGVEVGRVYLPHEPAIDAALARYFTAVNEGRFQVLMGRPLAVDCDDAEIAAIFQAPGAIAWPTDDF